MKNTVIPAAIALTSSLSGVAQSTAWQLDPPHSAAQVAVKHMGISTGRGAFTKLTGTVHYDPADTKNDSVDVTFDATPVDSRVEMRDKRMNAGDYIWACLLLHQ